MVWREHFWLTARTTRGAPCASAWAGLRPGRTLVAVVPASKDHGTITAVVLSHGPYRTQKGVRALRRRAKRLAGRVAPCGACQPRTRNYRSLSPKLWRHGERAGVRGSLLFRVCSCPPPRPSPRKNREREGVTVPQISSVKTRGLSQLRPRGFSAVLTI